MVYFIQNVVNVAHEMTGTNELYLIYQTSDKLQNTRLRNSTMTKEVVVHAGVFVKLCIANLLSLFDAYTLVTVAQRRVWSRDYVAVLQ